MFRFTIRELVLLTLVVAMGIGWWLDRSRLVERAELAESYGLQAARYAETLVKVLDSRLPDWRTDPETYRP